MGYILRRPAVSTIDPVATCAWDAVIVSTLATNMAQKQKMGEPLKPSNSKGFRINGVLLPTTKVTRDLLMKWAIGKGRSKARKLTTELANHIGSACARQEAKERIAAYRLLKRSDDSDGDDDNPYDDSQESLIISIVECETFISDYESQHCDQKKLLKSSLRDLSNEK